MFRRKKYFKTHNTTKLSVLLIKTRYNNKPEMLSSFHPTDNTVPMDNWTLVVSMHTCSCTLWKSTRLRSTSIWSICDEFWRTARAAWARWFRDVYRRKVCAKALTADTLMCIISSGQPAMAAVSHDSRPFAKLRMACVNEPRKKRAVCNIIFMNMVISKLNSDVIRNIIFNHSFIYEGSMLKYQYYYFLMNTVN